MGGGRFNMTSYKAQAAAASERPYDGGFTATSMCDEFDPKKVKTRYSKKGPFNSFRNVITALIGLDVTGSMGDIPKNLLQGKLGSLISDLEKSFLRPNENLQICFTGVGDSRNDRAPLQVAHFESDNRIGNHLGRLWLEGGGGGNGAESYNLTWWYAANKTQLNYVLEEGRKGVLITVGDDNVHPELTAAEIRNYLDPNYEGGDISNPKLLEAAREQYDVYHIIVTDGAAFCHDEMTKEKKDAVVKRWKDLLGDDKVILAVADEVANAISNIIKRQRPVVKAGMANLTSEAWEKITKENLTDAQWLEVLSYTICPLSGRYMDQPGDWNDSKRAYEKEFVVNHVRANGQDPITNNPLTLAKLNFKINSNISQLCADYKPYFNALPEDRKKRLVQLALDQMKAAERSVGSHAPSAAATSSTASSSVPAAASPSASSLPFFEHKQAAASSSKAVIKDDNIPEGFICPISGNLMDDPVFTEDGYTYDRKSIMEWFEKHSTSPTTNLVIGKKLTPDRKTRSEIMQWKEEQAAKKVVSTAKTP